MNRLVLYNGCVHEHFPAEARSFAAFLRQMPYDLIIHFTSITTPVQLTLHNMSLTQAVKGDMPYQVRSLVRMIGFILHTMDNPRPLIITAHSSTD